MAFKCFSKQFGRSARFRFGKAFMHSCIEKVTRISKALLDTISVLYKDPSFLCLRVLRQYVNLMTSTFLIPFVHHYDVNYKEGIPMLRPSVGPRRSITVLAHFIGACRACWLIRIFFHENFKVLHDGSLTLDFCVVAADSLTAAAMIVAWVKTWAHTARMAWLHNSFHRLNRNLAR